MNPAETGTDKLPSPSRLPCAKHMTRFHFPMRNIRIALAGLVFLAMPAFAGKLVDAPPPPPMPDTLPEMEVAPPQPAIRESVGLGRLLYENHCTSCHESGVHIRSRHAVRTLPQLRETVVRWSEYARLPWREEEIEAVVRYLNDSFYHY